MTSPRDGEDFLRTVKTQTVVGDDGIPVETISSQDFARLIQIEALSGNHNAIEIQKNILDAGGIDALIKRQIEE